MLIASHASEYEERDAGRGIAGGHLGQNLPTAGTGVMICSGKMASAL